MLWRKAGIALIVLAFTLLLYTSLAARAYARAHPHLGVEMLAEYARPWPIALGSAIAVASIMLALVPLRRGERWAFWSLLAVLIILLIHGWRAIRIAWWCSIHVSMAVTLS